MDLKSYSHPCAWNNKEISSNEDWIIYLDKEDIAEIEAALAAVNARKLDIPKLSRDDFVLPNIARKMQDVLQQLEKGRGFVLIRGLPVDRYSKTDAARI